jgi:LPS O-antigen subunit length determinant protein (WzzB/FepE family)
MSDYTPKDDLEYTLRWWWLPVLFMLLGICVGLVFNQLFPPQYEAQAEITVSIDITRTGTLTGESQDMLIDSVGDIIDSTEAINLLKTKTTSLPGYAYFLERKADRFALRVQSQLPLQAQQVASLWSEITISTLDMASQHAIAAEILERYIESLTNCFSQIPSSGTTSEACLAPTFDSIQMTIDEAGLKLQEEKALSYGLIPGVRYWLSKSPEVPVEPVQYNRKYLLLGGALMGLVVSVWLLHLRIPDRIFRRKLSD